MSALATVEKPRPQLVRYEAMRNAIAVCHSVDEIKDLHDKALALELYTRQARDLDAEKKASDIRLRAERRVLRSCKVAAAPSTGGEFLEALQFIEQRYKIETMIQSFSCPDTEALFVTGKCRRWAGVKAVAERKLQQLDSAATLEFLKAPPGNHLEPLVGDRAGQHSIRINKQWRVCFVWTSDGPMNVEIVDYH